MGSTAVLSAKYIAGMASCQHISGSGYTYFVVLGTGTDSYPQNAKRMVKFLENKYSSKIKKYCKKNTIEDIEVYYFKSKHKVINEFKRLIDYCYSYDSNARKTFKIRFYHEKQWK